MTTDEQRKEWRQDAIDALYGNSTTAPADWGCRVLALLDERDALRAERDRLAAKVERLTRVARNWFPHTELRNALAGPAGGAKGGDEDVSVDDLIGGNS